MMDRRNGKKEYRFAPPVHDELREAVFCVYSGEYRGVAFHAKRQGNNGKESSLRTPRRNAAIQPLEQG